MLSGSATDKLIASVQITGPQPNLDNIGAVIDAGGMSSSQASLVKQTLQTEVEDASSSLKDKIQIVTVVGIVVTTTTSTSTTMTSTTQTTTSSTLTTTKTSTTTTTTTVTTTSTETTTTTLPSIQRGFGFVVDLTSEASFGLADAASSTELENSAKYAMAQLIKSQTGDANYQALLGLENPDITLLAGTANGLLASIGIQGPQPNLDAINNAIAPDQLTDVQKQVLEDALIAAVANRPSISTKLSIKPGQSSGQIVTTTTSTSTTVTSSSTTVTETSTSTVTTVTSTSTVTTLTETTTTITTTQPSIQAGFGFKITITQSGLMNLNGNAANILRNKMLNSSLY